MKKLWRWLRTLDAGEGIALAVLTAGLLIVGWGTISGIWSAIVGSLQPEMVKVKGKDYDLIAQRSMSAAAWWMVVITGSSTMVGGLGLYLIARTLQEAKRSADAAELAVQASQQAIVTAREMGQAQVRAYLIVTELETSYNSGGTPREHFISATFENSGETPAGKIYVEIEVFAGTDDRTKASILYRSETVSDLATGKAAKVAFWTDKIAAVPGNGDTSFWEVELVLTITYEDVFGQDREIVTRYFDYQYAPIESLDLARDISKE